MTLNQVVNLGVAVGQNLPYNHVVQAWNAQTGASLPTFPQAVEDFQLLSSPSVADVSDSPGNEILVGTGLYYLRNFNVAGIEGAGWPKFTGGWIFATPSIGDTDGDGDLEVTTLTREGFSFMWDTDRPACGTNDEWWTSRHDEWNTGAYGTDSRPPGTPRDLHFNLIGPHVVTLAWTAPGDDWLCGQGASYRIIASDQPIEHPSDGTVIGDFAATASAGQDQSKLVTNINSQYRYFAVMYKDDAGNWGHLASASLTYPRPKGATSAQRLAGPGLQGLHSPEPGARAAPGRPVVRAARAGVQLADARYPRRQRVGGQLRQLGTAFARSPATPAPRPTRRTSASPSTSPTCAAPRQAPHVPRARAPTTPAGCSRPRPCGSPTSSTAAPSRRTGRWSTPGSRSRSSARRRPESASARTARSTPPWMRCCRGRWSKAKRAIWQTGAIAVEDAGPNGTGYGAGCPSACGDGDETVFMRQGIFVP